MKIDEATFVLLDTETTGKDETDPKNEIIEIAAIRMTYDGTLCDHFESLVFPLGTIPPESSGVHHLTDEDLIGAPGWESVSARFAAFVPADAILVAHHAKYDRGVMRGLLAKAPWLCTERLARHVLPDAPDFKLQTLRYVFGHRRIDLRGGAPHRAMADVLVLREVFVSLLKCYEDEARKLVGADDDRFARSREVGTLIEYLKRPYIMRAWPMGPAQAKGKPFRDIDAGLLQWALRKADIDDDLRFNVQREIKRRSAEAAARAAG